MMKPPRSLSQAGLLFILFHGALANAGEYQGVLPCITQNVVAFGSSVTSAVPSYAPGAAYSNIANAAAFIGKYNVGASAPAEQNPHEVPEISRAYGQSPVRYIVKALGGKKALSHVSSVANFVQQDPGISQLASFLQGENQSKFRNATLLIGVDAFYWDAIQQTCGYGAPHGIEPWISAFITRAKLEGKVLILGTVPIEDVRTVRIASANVGIENIWYPPEENCVASINRTIRRDCTAENRCYIADLHKTVESLNNKEKLHLNADGKDYGLYDLRPDGLHLSDVGTRYLSQIVLEQMMLHPPTCSIK